MVLWFIGVTTWDFCTNEGRKAAASEEKRAACLMLRLGRRIGGNKGRRYYVASSGSEYSDCPSWHFRAEKSTNLATWSYSTDRCRKVDVALSRSVRMALGMPPFSLRFVARMELVQMFNCVPAMI